MFVDVVVGVVARCRASLLLLCLRLVRLLYSSSLLVVCSWVCVCVARCVPVVACHLLFVIGVCVVLVVFRR